LGAHGNNSFAQEAIVKPDNPTGCSRPIGSVNSDTSRTGQHSETLVSSHADPVSCRLYYRYPILIVYKGSFKVSQAGLAR
jgi:hypothetical protein